MGASHRSRASKPPMPPMDKLLISAIFALIAASTVLAVPIADVEVGKLRSISNVEDVMAEIRKAEDKKDCGQPLRKLKDCFSDYMSCFMTSYGRYCSHAYAACLKAN